MTSFGFSQHPAAGPLRKDAMVPLETQIPLNGLLGALWRHVDADPKLKVYALQDAAASPRIYPNLVLAPCESVCLYAQPIPLTLLQAAPHLAQLQAAAPYTRWYAQEGFGKAWGVYLQAHEGLMALRTHFQRLLLVKDEAGRRLLFRYFDPRVLRAYLPSCTSQELRQFFGPVKRFFAESDDKNHIEAYALEGDRLHVETLALGAAREPALLRR